MAVEDCTELQKEQAVMRIFVTLSKDKVTGWRQS
jgi:hypothetical protein